METLSTVAVGVESSQSSLMENETSNSLFCEASLPVTLDNGALQEYNSVNQKIAVTGQHSSSVSTYLDSSTSDIDDDSPLEISFATGETLKVHKVKEDNRSNITSSVDNSSAALKKNISAQHSPITYPVSSSQSVLSQTSLLSTQLNPPSSTSTKVLSSDSNSEDEYSLQSSSSALSALSRMCKY